MKALMLLCIVAALGCASTPLPCKPVPCKPVEVKVPTPVWVVSARLPDLQLPTYPPHPGVAASPEELKSWAVGTARVVLDREALLLGRIDALETQLEAAREQK